MVTTKNPFIARLLARLQDADVQVEAWQFAGLNLPPGMAAYRLTTSYGIVSTALVVEADDGGYRFFLEVHGFTIDDDVETIISRLRS